MCIILSINDIIIVFLRIKQPYLFVKRVTFSLSQICNSKKKRIFVASKKIQHF